MKRYFFLLLILLFFSCSHERIIEEPGVNADNYVQILMNLPDLQNAETKSGGTTRAMDDVAERRIELEKFHVLVFKYDSGAETYVYKAPVSGNIQYETGDGTKAKVTVRLAKSSSGEQYRLVFIANQDLTSVSLVVGSTSKADLLQQLTYAASGKWNVGTEDYTPFPMWGESALVAVSESMPAQSVDLYRALSRIDIGLNLSITGSGALGETASGVEGFKLKEVKVYRTYDKGYVAPLNSSMTSYATPFIPDAAQRRADDAPLSYAITDDEGADKYVREIYLPEAALPSSPAKDNMHCIIIGGYYRGSSSVSYYRLDFATENPAGERSYLPILRNHRYVFNINAVRGPGFTSPEAALRSTSTIENLGYEVIAWNEYTNNMEVQGKYYFGLGQNVIRMPAQHLDPANAPVAKTFFYQTNLPSAEDVTWEWKKGDDSPFYVVNHNPTTKRFIIASRKRNTTNTILTDTLFVKAGPFSMPVCVGQDYVNFKYTIDCAQTTVYGTYVNGEALNSSHFIRVKLDAEDSSIMEEEYVVETVDMEGDHGIQFSARAAFRNNPQWVVLQGTGTLNHNPADGPFKLRIKTNSSSGSYCEVTITPIDQPMNILVLADTGDGSGFDIGYSNMGANKLLTAPANFGSSDNSIVKVGGFNFIRSTIYDFSLYSTSDPYKWVTGTGNGGKIADLVYIAYPAVFSSNTALLLKEYMEKGGVVVAFMEFAPTAGFLVNHLLGRADITATSRGASGYIYPFPAHASFNLNSEELANMLRKYGSDPILNGPFGDVRDKQWGEDRSATVTIDNLPENANITIYSYLNNISATTPDMANRQVNSFKYESEEKNFIWFGDGGFMASLSGRPYADPNGFPLYWDTTSLFPIPKPVYGVETKWPVYNSTVFCNVMAWAIKKSQSLKSKRESNQ